MKHSNQTKNMTARRLRQFAISICLASGVATTAVSTEARADGDTEISRERVYWVWNNHKVMGRSKLIRSADGLKAKVETRGLGRFKAYTLWIVVFNNPDACATDPCTVADLENTETEGDFLYGGGAITSGGFTRFAGKLDVGDKSGSGAIELFGIPEEFAVGLTNPMGADVLLAIHSHGPAGSGSVLKSQVSSFLGGCIPPFLGDGFGWALGREDIPDEPGECSTVQVSTHRAD